MKNIQKDCTLLYHKPTSALGGSLLVPVRWHIVLHILYCCVQCVLCFVRCITVCNVYCVAHIALLCAMCTVLHILYYCVQCVLCFERCVTVCNVYCVLYVVFLCAMCTVLHILYYCVHTQPIWPYTHNPCAHVLLRVLVCVCVGLARTIYIRRTYGIFGLKITKYTVYIYVYIRFWPTLCMCCCRVLMQYEIEQLAQPRASHNKKPETSDHTSRMPKTYVLNNTSHRPKTHIMNDRSHRPKTHFTQTLC